MSMHAPGTTGSDEASPPHHAPPSSSSPPDISASPGRGGTRRSGKARTRAGAFFPPCDRVRPHSARRGEAQAQAQAQAQARTFSSPSSPHGTPLYVARAPACVGDAIMAPLPSPPLPLSSPHDGSEKRRAVSVYDDVSDPQRPTARGHDEHSALAAFPAPADTVDPAGRASAAMHRIDHAWRWRHSDSPVTPPIFVCVRLNLFVCRSVRPFCSVLTLFLSTTRRSIDIIGRALHARPLPVPIEAPNVSFWCRDGTTTFVRGRVGHGVRSCIA